MNKHNILSIALITSVVVSTLLVVSQGLLALLFQGSTSEKTDIAILQGFLKESGFYSGKIDGIYTPQISEATKSWQIDWNSNTNLKTLYENGLLGPDTLIAMGFEVDTMGNIINTCSLYKYHLQKIKGYQNLASPEKASRSYNTNISYLVLPIKTGTDAGYSNDTGLDILAPMGTDCIAAASGNIIYSEKGHTKWNTYPDTPNSVFIKLDRPIINKNKKAEYIWYTHLSELKYSKQKDDNKVIHVNAGDIIGKSGLGNRIPHLHFGIIINEAQSSKDDYFSMEEVRALLGLKPNKAF